MADMAGIQACTYRPNALNALDALGQIDVFSNSSSTQKCHTFFNSMHSMHLDKQPHLHISSHPKIIHIHQFQTSGIMSGSASGSTISYLSIISLIRSKSYTSVIMIRYSRLSMNN
ncbi:MAG: hypothetical protein EZS28_040359 [Streblomastix strix]|uniref:Uncharacterized protein n=1 Tax=Streblomastix strix TaxID=222440 RepID=A0A5J4U394_9EUKA|nr:MAG: hypothetical protein EZS28_040359 [Streblomastix strix]